MAMRVALLSPPNRGLMHGRQGYGQSNFAGGGGDAGSPAVPTPSPLSDRAFMFNSGISASRTQTLFNYGRASFFTPAFEVQFNANTAETPCTRLMHEVNADRTTRGLAARKVFMHTAAAGGQTVEQLRYGNGAFTNLVESVRAFIRICRKLGYTPRMPYIHFLQGEANYGDTKASYKTSILAMMDEIDAYVYPLLRAANSSHPAMQLLIGQLPTGLSGDLANVDVAQLEAAVDHDRIWISTPVYMLGRDEPSHYNGEHLSYFAALAARAENELEETGAVKMLRVNGNAVSTDGGTTFDLTYTDNTGNLKNSNAFNAAQTASGYTFSDGTGVSSVAFPSANVVRVTAASAVAAGTKIHYAIPRSGSADPYRAGNITDSRGGTASYNGAWVTDRWAVNQIIDTSIS